MSLLPRWFENLSFPTQIIAYVVVVDPIAFAAGYLLAPEFGVSPLMGGLRGLVIAGFPLSLLILREANRQ